MPALLVATALCVSLARAEPEEPTTPASTQASAPEAESASPPPAGPTPLALTVSGGVSLGSYEAGFLFYLTEWLKLNPERAQLHVATGASAGSSNALFSLLGACTEPTSDPRQTLFWAWVGLGLDDLFDPDATTGVGLLSAEGAASVFDTMRMRWKLGLQEGCDALFGATVTRLEPDRVVVADGGLRLPRLEERFTLRIQGHGVARQPSIDNYRIVAPRAEYKQLYIDPDDPVGALQTLLSASSAFPIALPPVELEYCRSQGTSEEVCSGEAVERSLFIDGGVFDNTPVQLAVRLMRRGTKLRGDGRVAVLPVADADSDTLPPDARFVVVAPSLAAEALRVEQENEGPTSALPLAWQFLGTFITTARARELTHLFEGEPGLRDRVRVAQESLPPMGGHMYAFLGFFEEKLRSFDFVLGMYEARRFLEDEWKGLAHAQQPPRWPEPAEEVARHDVVYQPLLCLRQTLAGGPGEASACEGPGMMRDFRAALQVAMEVLHERCRRGLVHEDASQCELVRQGDLPRLVTGLARVPGHTRAAGEGETSYVLRRLSDYRFEFRDLGLGRDEADQVKQRMRGKLEEVVAALARAQRQDGVGQVLGVRAVGRTAANAVAYQPPRYTAHLSIGAPSEVGGTGLIPARRFMGLRWAVSLQVWGLETLLSSEPRTFGFGPVAGLELEPVRWNGPYAQLRFGGAAGYVVFRRDGTNRTRCDFEQTPDGVCSRPVTQAYMTLSVLELIRIGLHAAVLPKLKRGDARYYTIRPNLGVQLTF